ncbi:GntR family transcriptional regulator [Salinicoccus albus]|uniref:GntR family transcriptional regulator n=1 Tax=Salinicoccus albus TaxID=418756 RepID=UPI00036D42C8|nr:GntR family transcriptional regulator [Salinicoccus albus]
MKNYNSENKAYEQIKKAILLKKLLPGQRLSEKWLGDNLNMSRTPVRAALKKLEDERLVEMIINRGAFVYKPSMNEIKEVFEVRILLESYAAKIAALKTSKSDIKYLNSLLQKEKEAYKEKDFEKFIEVNSDIHLAPALIADNKTLINQIISLINWSNCYIILKDPFYERSVDTAVNIPEHEKIVEALSANNSKLAQQLVEKHLKTTLSSLEEPASIFED